MTHAGEPAGLEALLELRALPGIGDRRLRTLIEKYGSARAALDSPADELGLEAARSRGSRPVRDRVRRALDWLDREGAVILRDNDPAYPERLRDGIDPPVVLFALGRLELLERTGVAVVGARRHTHYGADAARMVAGGLARAGIVVISGLARGIDAIAHRAALEEGPAGGGTIAVLGCGLDVCYPWENRLLHRRIAEEGLLLSEFLPGEPAMRYHFPRRNRIMAGLARAVVVVEASSRSGSLITVDHALDLGRDVLAVPGPIGRPTSEGTNELIRDGAAMVTAVADILGELERVGGPGPAAAAEPASGVARGPAALRAARAARAAGPAPSPTPRPEPRGLGAESRLLLRALEAGPRHIDELAGACGLAPGAALAALLELELKGHARQLPGKRVVAI